MQPTGIANTPQRYGWIAIALHWAMAALLVVLVGLGLYMVRLPDVGYDREKITLILVHKSLGMFALAAVVLRIGWRLVNELPRFVDGLPEWQQVSAMFVHLWMYALMFALPLTGWLNSSAGGYPVPVVPGFDAPDLIGHDEALFDALLALHRWLAWALIFFAVPHAAAALRHHFLSRDETLRKMLPGR